MRRLISSSKALLFCGMMLLPAISHAHTNWCNSRCGGSCNCGYGGSYCAPLDGGLSLLLVAGAGYGIKRYSKSRRKKSTDK